MAETNKKVKLVAYDAAGGAPMTAWVDPQPDDTIGGVFERAFPDTGAEKGRLYGKVDPDTIMPMSKLAEYGSFITKGDGTTFEWKVRAVRQDKDVALTVTPSILHECVEKGNGMLTVNSGGHVLASYTVKVKQIHLPTGLYLLCGAPISFISCGSSST